MKKILVALDGSKASNNALNFALQLAEMSSASLELLTVVPPVFFAIVFDLCSQIRCAYCLC